LQRGGIASGLSRAYGDALTISGDAQGGDDSLTGGNVPSPVPAGTYDTMLEAMRRPCLTTRVEGTTS
jgi:hypothetical protein